MHGADDRERIGPLRIVDAGERRSRSGCDAKRSLTVTLGFSEPRESEVGGRHRFGYTRRDRPSLAAFGKLPRLRQIAGLECHGGK